MNEKKYPYGYNAKKDIIYTKEQGELFAGIYTYTSEEFEPHE